MIDFFLKDIETHFFREYPKEACGILAVQKGKPKWFPCTNVAKENENFIIDSNEYLKIHRTSDIIGIVHNHPDETSEASETDIAHCNTLGILYGREYEFGVKDCFEAMRDYLKTVDINIPPRILFEDNWWTKKLDYFCPEIIKEWGGEEVSIKEIQKNDVITFSVRSDVANHCGIYLENDVFYHHAENRLSCRENLFPYWIQYIDRVYRYAA